MVYQQTSMEAFYLVSREMAKRESLVLDTIRSLGGKATAWEIMDLLRIQNPNMIRPRLTDLYRKGYVVKFGQAWNAKHKCTEIVWEINEEMMLNV